MFPVNLFKPLVENLKVMFRSRPLALAMLGIAFFIFMVAYMRATMYMHGETRNPRWDEEKTSLIVATVALGVGLGSPLAGYLSGGKIELGLVPLGCLGMIFALLISALATGTTSAFPAALEDRMHQPYRAALVPGLSEIIKLRAPGLLGCALSGAGPSILVFYERGRENVCELVRNIFAAHAHASEVLWTELAGDGYVLS